MRRLSIGARRSSEIPRVYRRGSTEIALIGVAARLEESEMMTVEKWDVSDHVKDGRSFHIAPVIFQLDSRT